MFVFIANRFSKEQKEMERLKLEYRHANFPDKTLVDVTIKQLDILVSIEDSTAFFTYLAENEERLIEQYEELQDIKAFFKSNQKEIYLDAKEKLALYDQDKNYLNNDEMDHLMNTVADILRLSRPYRRMKELPELIDQFNREIVQQLETVSQPISDSIEQDRRDIAKEIAGLLDYASIERIQTTFNFKMNDLEKKVDNSNTVGKLQAYKGESNEIKVVTLRAIESAKRIIYDEQEAARKKQVEEQNRKNNLGLIVEEAESTHKVSSAGKKSETKTLVKAERALIMRQTEILPRQVIEIRNEEDIDQYLTILKGNLMKSLADKYVDFIKLS